MGDSDESFFWDDKEDEYGGFFSTQDFQNNHSFEAANQSLYDEDSFSKRITLSPDSDQPVLSFSPQNEGEEDSSSHSSPLGLTLSKTPSFLSLLQRSLSKGKHAIINSDNTNLDNQPKKKMDDLGSEKLKASNFPAFFIQIGSWQRVTRHEGDLTAKLYYAKRKLVWEVLDGALKSKIEIQWSDITAIRAITPDNEPGTLEIELNQPPVFYREINPQPRKHTLWQQASDFTGGQAPIWRRHYVKFPTGMLDKHYEKLLQCDQRLSALSQKPFPSHESPYFDPTMFGISQFSLIFNGYVMNFPYTNDGGNISQVAAQTNPPPTSWDEGNQANFLSHHQQYYQPNVGLLSDIEQHLLGESHAVPLENQATVVESMSSWMGPTDVGLNYLDVSPSYLQGNSGNDDQVRHIAGNYNNIPNVTEALYSQNVNWQLPPADDDSLYMEQQMMSNNNSLPPYFFNPGTNPTTGGFF
ncbi:ATP-dependent DNA helicase [Perilla frutescens var. hirtella]|uniref:ATP-dependent DNA helicase n=1 Tax=Perilla frutescens var. hirtella TaxID=608512 RepID=A0AAD4IS14_PERFH|nr:ATP-dependent DNA helicase [Perilla frutescens var. hirtella]